jgi:hypothetical protein
LDNLFDPVRKKKLQNFPEEIVRQKLLRTMIYDLKYPKELLSVEQDLAGLTHLKEKKHQLPTRRADIICFAKDLKGVLYPLLMIECKANALNQKALDQVIGYNHYVKAYFIALANKNEIKTLWYDNNTKKYESVNFLPSYDQLIESVIS